MYTIIKRNNGTFRCIGKLQDVTERWICSTLEEAIDSMKQFARTMNGTKLKKSGIAYLQEQSVPLVEWKPF
jgi:hypothetical protein